MDDLFAAHLAHNRRDAESLSLVWSGEHDCRSLLPFRLR